MKPLLVFALAQESQDVFAGYDVLYTGVGKVNAVYSLTQHFMERGKPSLVINLGTAGGIGHKPGSIVNPTSFVQRDMDVSALGFAPYQTPFSDDPVRINSGRRILDFPDGVCGSGDNFANALQNHNDYDVIDMEAYALALICQRMDVPFLCLKYISDGADDNAHKDWHEALNHTAKALKAALLRVSC